MVLGGLRVDIHQRLLDQADRFLEFAVEKIEANFDGHGQAQRQRRRDAAFELQRVVSRGQGAGSLVPNNGNSGNQVRKEERKKRRTTYLRDGLKLDGEALDPVAFLVDGVEGGRAGRQAQAAADNQGSLAGERYVEFRRDADKRAQDEDAGDRNGAEGYLAELLFLFLGDSLVGLERDLDAKDGVEVEGLFVCKLEGSLGDAVLDAKGKRPVDGEVAADAALETLHAICGAVAGQLGPGLAVKELGRVVVGLEGGLVVKGKVIVEGVVKWHPERGRDQLGADNGHLHQNLGHGGRDLSKGPEEADNLLKIELVLYTRDNNKGCAAVVGDKGKGLGITLIKLIRKLKTLLLFSR